MKEKVSANDVLESLKRTGRATRFEIATDLECSTATVSKKVAKLVKDGENIGFDNSGLFIYNKADMVKKENAENEHNWSKRVVASLAQWARRGNNTRPILIEARKHFGKELTTQERKQLKSHLLMITRVVDAVDIDEEFKE